MDRMILEQIEKKAEVLTDALPYIRDFNRQVAVIEYGCRKYMSPVGEQELMRDIALLKTVGMKPVVVHGCPIGVDKFRENKGSPSSWSCAAPRRWVSAAWIWRPLPSCWTTGISLSSCPMTSTRRTWR